MEPDPTRPTPTWRSGTGRHGAIVLPLLLLLMLLLTLAGPLPESGAGHLDAAAERALASFAIARGLNGVISVVQETEVGFSLGVRGSIEPGQVLDPLNDLIERFSLVALAAATLLWSLKLLGAFVVAPLPVAIALILWAGCFALARLDRWGSRDIGLLGHRLVRVFVVVWAFAALTPLVIDQVHRSDVVREVYTQASNDLASAGSALADLGRFDGVPSMADLEQRVARVTGFADDMSRDAVAVLAVYLFEVVMVPLLIFWLGSRLLPGRWTRN